MRQLFPTQTPWGSSGINGVHTSAGLGICAPRGSTPDHDVRLALQRNRLAQDARVLAECRAPQAITQHHGLARAGLIFVLGETAPQERGDSEHLEVMRRDSYVVHVAHCAALRRARLPDSHPRCRQNPRPRSPAVTPGTSCLTARHAALSEESSSSKRAGLLFNSRCDTSAAMRSGCGYGRVRSRKPSSRLKTAVLTPIASASVTTTAAANPGLRCNCRKAYFRSSSMSSSYEGRPRPVPCRRLLTPS